MKIRIGVMTCASKDIYRQELVACNNTWGKHCEEWDIPVYFFSGDRKYGVSKIENPRLIYLDDVGDDYLSATDKQWLGLKYMFDNDPADFYCILGTDNYVWPDKVFPVMEKYIGCGAIVVSGYQQERTIGRRRLVFPFGGSGIFISHAAVEKIYSRLTTFRKEWCERICRNEDLNPACDVALAYLCEEYSIPMVREYPFYTLSLYGTVKGSTGMMDVGVLDYKTLAIVHCMTPEAMRLCYKFRKSLEFCMNFEKKVTQYFDHQLYNYAKKSKTILFKNHPSNKYFFNIVKGICDKNEYIIEGATIDTLGFDFNSEYTEILKFLEIPFSKIEKNEIVYELTLD